MYDFIRGYKISVINIYNLIRTAFSYSKAHSDNVIHNLMKAHESIKFTKITVSMYHIVLILFIQEYKCMFSTAFRAVSDKN